MRRLLVCALVCVLSASCVPYDKEAAINREKGRIQGAWTPLSMTYHGRQLDKDELDTFKVVIGNSSILVEGKLLREESTMSKESWYWLNPMPDPKEIDLGFNGTMSWGIYKLDGDILTIRIGGKAGRPADFETSHPAGYETYVLKRSGAAKN